MSNHLAFEDSFHVHPVPGLLGSFHLLHDASRREACLIDTGLIGELPRLKRTLRQIDLEWTDIKAILLTHGHLDHAGNLARLKDLTGAPVLAHPLEQLHIDGKFPYTGASRICGFLETVGRCLFQYRPVAIDQPISDTDELPFWDGLHVIHLPGHTKGHCGFYSPRFNLLFSGDLFASYGFSVHPPPVILNSCPERIPTSLAQVQRLSPLYIIPNHYDQLDGALHRRRFDLLLRKLNFPRIPLFATG